MDEWIELRREIRNEQIPLRQLERETGIYRLHYGQGKSVVLNYLARYVFRIVITNNRIISMGQRHVIFHYKDRKGGRWLTSRIEGSEFIRRYLQHVLPKGFHKVRYYGIWHKSNSNHVSTLANSMPNISINSRQ